MALITLGCSKKNVIPSAYSGDMMIVGSGGGFTGAYSTYYILDDGAIYRQNMQDTVFVKIGELSKKVVKHQFRMYDDMKLGELELNDPGNRYHYLTYRDKSKNEHKIQWGKSTLEDKRISIFHDNLMKLIKSMNQN